jgi:tetratricopeptide (TPR) repeat protein/cellulose biosynthesis protein BcsQ
MKTVTFYSYKGGVGRTLALANIAMRLSEFGKKVCILDFDLEAPGVHYKFPKVDLHNRKGIVDYIYEYVKTKERPENLEEMVINLPPSIKDGAPILLIPAGDIHNKNYWSNLSNINWTELLYKDDGILFLLDFKERIKNELNPDFLLIDSRTGITEIAGITISLLADHVTLLAVNNPENLFGCKQLLNSIQDPSRNLFKKTIQSTFVLTRIPALDKDIDIDYAKHGGLLKKVAGQIFDDSERYKEIIIIHSDDELLLQESLKINLPLIDNKTKKKNTQKNTYNKSSPITQDYLNLFEMLTQGYLTDQESIKLKRNKKAATLFKTVFSIEDENEKLSLIDKVLILNDKFELAYLLRGSIYGDQNEYSKSIEELTKGIEIKPGFSEGYYIRGIVYYKLKQYYEAILDYTKAIEIKPDDCDYYYIRGLAHSNLEQYNEAIIDYSKAIEIKPDASDYYKNRGLVYNNLEQYNEAVLDYTKAIEIKPDDCEYYNIRGLAYTNLEQYNEAILDYTKAIDIDGNNPDLYSNLAQIYFFQSNKEKAKKLIDKAFTLNPELPLQLELWFYRYAHFPEWRDVAKTELEMLMSNSEAKSIGWDFSKNIEIAIAEGHPEPEELKRIAKQITEK